MGAAVLLEDLGVVTIATLALAPVAIAVWVVLALPPELELLPPDVVEAAALRTFAFQLIGLQ